MQILACARLAILSLPLTLCGMLRRGVGIRVLALGLNIQMAT